MEATRRTRTYLNTLSSEDPDRPFLLEELAGLEQTRFEEFGVRGGDNAAASLQMANSDSDPWPIPDRRDPGPHIEALNSIIDLTGLTDIEKAIEYCRDCLDSPYSHRLLTLVVLGYRLFDLTGEVDTLDEYIP